MTSAMTSTTVSVATSSEVAVFPETGNLQFASVEVKYSALALTPNQITQSDVHTPTELVSAAPVPLPLDPEAMGPEGKLRSSSKTGVMRHRLGQTGRIATEKATAPGSVLPSTSMSLTDTKVSSESKHDHSKETLDPGAFDPIVPHDGVPWTLHEALASAKTPDKPPDEQKASSVAVASEAMRKRAVSLPMVEVLAVAMDGQRVKPAVVREKGRSARLEADKALGLDTVVPPRRSHWSDDCGLL